MSESYSGYEPPMNTGAAHGGINCDCARCVSRLRESLGRMTLAELEALQAEERASMEWRHARARRLMLVPEAQ